MIYLVSHKKPDTDSIVATIVMKYFLKKLGKEVKACRAGKINGETAYILNYLKQKPPVLINDLSERKIFLIDHNEIEQGCKGMEKAEIVGILDHHRLGGLETIEPIFSRIEAIGSTSTLVFKLFQEKRFLLSRKQASLLLAGIISDTLKFISPTTTKEDKKIAKKLEGISGENIEKLSKEMFKARFHISRVSLGDLIRKDYKEFQLDSTKVGVAVWETIIPKEILEEKQKILKLLTGLKKERRVDLIYFGVIDVLKKECYFFLIDKKEKKIAEKAFGKKEKESLIYLPGVLSRKKQIIPKLAKILGK